MQVSWVSRTGSCGSGDFTSSRASPLAEGGHELAKLLSGQHLSTGPTIPVSKRKKGKLREKGVTQGLTASRWKSLDLSSAFLIPGPVPVVPTTPHGPWLESGATRQGLAVILARPVPQTGPRQASAPGVLKQGLMISW